jgi:hypothetical protein
MRTFLLGAMLILGSAACGAPPPGPPPVAGVVLPRDLAGCYALNRTKSLYFAPPRIRLDSTAAVDESRGFTRDSAWALARLNAQGGAIVDERTHPILYWKAASADSIRIMISTGFSGSALTVAARADGDTLHGRGVEFWDMGPTENDAGPVTLVRIPCVTTR